MTKHLLLSALAAAGALSAAGVALAASPTYVGRWSETSDACRNGEAHLLDNGLCRFHKISGGSWHATMTCAGEGSTERISAEVEGDFLSVIYGKPYNTTAKFKRCGTSGTATAEPGQPAAAALAQQTPEAPRHPVDTGAYRAKAMAFLADDIASARSGGSNPKVFWIWWI